MDAYDKFKKGERLKTGQIVRLFGKDFKEEEPQLTLVAYSKSYRGNICGYYAYTDEFNDENRKAYCHFYHWMNDDQKEHFLMDGISDHLVEVNSIKEVMFPRSF